MKQRVFHFGSRGDPESIRNAEQFANSRGVEVSVRGHPDSSPDRDRLGAEQIPARVEAPHQLRDSIQQSDRRGLWRSFRTTLRRAHGSRSRLVVLPRRRPATGARDLLGGPPRRLGALLLRHGLPSARATTGPCAPPRHARSAERILGCRQVASSVDCARRIVFEYPRFRATHRTHRYRAQLKSVLTHPPARLDAQTARCCLLRGRGTLRTNGAGRGVRNLVPKTSLAVGHSSPRRCRRKQGRIPVLYFLGLSGRRGHDSAVPRPIRQASRRAAMELACAGRSVRLVESTAGWSFSVASLSSSLS